MHYEAISDAHGQSAVCIRLSPVDQGIVVAATKPMVVSVSSRRNGSTCVMPARSYLAVADSVDDLLARTSERPGQPVFCGRDVAVKRARGYVVVKALTARSELDLVDAEFLSLGHDPKQVISSLQIATGIPLALS